MDDKIKNIQALLLKYFNKKSWQQYIDSQKYGICDFIAFLVNQMCSDFKIICVEYNFSKLAIKQLNEKNDFGDTFGTHYLNEYNGQLYDFGKGTNTIAGIYLLKFNNFDKYTITLTQNEKHLLTNIQEKILYEIYFKQKIKPEYIGILNNQPQYLYHATYKALLSSIRQKGLGNTKRTFWEDSKPGIIYLADDPNIAESYAEANENCPEEWIDQIIIFQIPILALDKNKLFADKNVIDGGDTFEYHGIIPFDLLKIYQSETFENIYNNMF